MARHRRRGAPSLLGDAGGGAAITGGRAARPDARYAAGAVTHGWSSRDRTKRTVETTHRPVRNHERVENPLPQLRILRTVRPRCVDTLRRTQLETSAALLQLVADFARQHHAGIVDPVQAQLPGRERAVCLGGEGTPPVAEFAAAMLAARMALSAHAGSRVVADILDLQYRLPSL